MAHLELVPMEEDFRQEIRKRYTGPLYRSSFLLTLLIGLCTFPIVRSALGAGTYNQLGALIPFALLALFIYPKIYRYKRYYYKDYQLGQVIKEVVVITKVFDTPSGINIYWLSSEAIKTFTPDPYRHFREGDILSVYYLKYAKEYLAYEE